MSRHVNITKLLIALIVACGCSTSTTRARQPTAILLVNHCVGDVVPLCSSIRVTKEGLMEYVLRGRPTLTGRLTQPEVDEFRQRADRLDVVSWSNNEDPIGSFVTLEVPSGKRTMTIIDAPVEAISILEKVDRAGRRLFGRTYRCIATSRSRPGGDESPPERRETEIRGPRKRRGAGVLHARARSQNELTVSVGSIGVFRPTCS